MWEVEEVHGTLYGTSYLIKNTNDQGYLACNAPGGGTLHFMFKDEAMDIVRLLNSCVIR